MLLSLDRLEDKVDGIFLKKEKSLSLFLPEGRNVKKKRGKGTKQRQDVTSDRKYNQWLEDGMRRAEEYQETGK